MLSTFYFCHAVEQALFTAVYPGKCAASPHSKSAPGVGVTWSVRMSSLAAEITGLRSRAEGSGLALSNPHSSYSQEDISNVFLMILINAKDKRPYFYTYNY